jgi:hypothetical protein
MPLPELLERSARLLLERYCAERVPACSCGRPRLEFAICDDRVTLFAERPVGGAAGQVLSAVAQFRFSPDLNQWTLHYPDPDQRWRFYLNAGPCLDLRQLLRHLDADPLHVFWS